jgi:excinuclease UvrABC ATPase subunit
MTDLDHIEVRGARESLVFGTIAAESQRLINATYTTFLQSLMPNIGRPDVDTPRTTSTSSPAPPGSSTSAPARATTAAPSYSLDRRGRSWTRRAR